MPTIDLYIARRMARPFLATGAIVILLLSLENSRRLMDLLDNVERPVPVLIKLMVYLVPEYLGIGLLISVFVAVALAFRGFAINGELDIFASIGLSPARLLRVPLLFGLAIALLHVGLRAYVEPAGEQRLDALGASIAIGNLGLAIAPGEFLSPRAETVFHVDAVDRRTGEFRGLFLRNRNLTVAARDGRVINGGRDGVLLRLADGHVIASKAGGRLEVAAFKTMAMPVQLLVPKPVRGTARHRNDRLMLGDLINVAVDGRTSGDRRAARAAIGGRFVTAAFIVLIPFYGFALGIPPKRSTSALGLGCGVLLIVGFVQGIVAIEDSALALAPLIQILILLGFAVAVFILFCFQRTQGPGAIDAALVSASRSARYYSRWTRLDRLMMRLPSERAQISATSQ